MPARAARRSLQPREEKIARVKNLGVTQIKKRININSFFRGGWPTEWGCLSPSLPAVPLPLRRAVSRSAPCLSPSRAWTSPPPPFFFFSLLPRPSFFFTLPDGPSSPVPLSPTHHDLPTSSHPPNPLPLVSSAPRDTRSCSRTNTKLAFAPESRGISFLILLYPFSLLF